MGRRLDAIWYGNHPLSLLLAPLSWLFCLVSLARRFAYRSHLFAVHRLKIPVIVVGNIVVGGTGKTPLVIWLAGFLKEQGHRPGIVCRGYGGSARFWPQQVRPDSDPTMVGDEAVLIAQRTRCPVAAGPDRVAAAQAVTTYTDCDVIISDDGMQHLALGRDLEIAVVDGVRRHGNGRCLPAGPLREPVTRLGQVDLVVANGKAARGEFEMALVAGLPTNVQDNIRTQSLDSFKATPVHALAGIGHPERFFLQLRRAGLSVLRHEFPDHHTFTREEIDFGDNLPVLMTEKDAVKCRLLAGPRHWYIPVEAQPHTLLADRVLALIREYWDGQEAA